MKLRIIELGPVKDSEIDVAQLTVFFGPPNTGKSYALKAIYSQLIPFDKYQVMMARRSLCAELRRRIWFVVALAKGAMRGVVKLGDSYRLEASYASVIIDEARREASVEVRVGDLEIGDAISINLALSLIEQLPAGTYRMEPSYAAYVTYPDISDVCNRCGSVCESAGDKLILRIGLGEGVDASLECLSRLIKRMCMGTQIHATPNDLADLAYIPFGRAPLVQLLDAAMGLHDFRALTRVVQSLSSVHSAYVARLVDGYRAFLRGPRNEVSRVLNLFGGFKASGGRIAYVVNGVETELGKASAMASEVLGIMLPLLTMGPGSLILIEEPEAQLHPAAQVLMGVALLALAELGYRLVVTTHSELLLATLASLIHAKPSTDHVAVVVSRAMELARVPPNHPLSRYVAALASSATEYVDSAFYYFDGGKARRVDPGEILSRTYSIQYLLDNMLSELIAWYADVGKSGT